VSLLELHLQAPVPATVVRQAKFRIVFQEWHADYGIRPSSSFGFDGRESEYDEMAASIGNCLISRLGRIHLPAQQLLLNGTGLIQMPAQKSRGFCLAL
jgi:hypothetical protein